ncbi:MAG: hypothetical protein L0H19_08505 [Salinisphaera sp.]|nr:hypothetical protein [Salinisphaera sp.]
MGETKQHIPPMRLGCARFWLAGLLALCASGCVVAPPRQPDNLCAIFLEKDDWYEATRDAYERWGTPIAVQMAIIYRESGYREEARPPRRWILWIIPWKRPSSAYGYSQALDSTWAWYERDSGNGWADRDDFDDAVDFVAWYVYKSRQIIGISQDDAYSNYLAYHEGQTGYIHKSYAGKSALLRAAARVQARAARYRRQLQGCRDELEDGWWPLW